MPPDISLCRVASEGTLKPPSSVERKYQNLLAYLVSSAVRQYRDANGKLAL
jgi:hypothetical protein